MANKKALNLTDLDEAAKNLSLTDLILHWQSVKAILEAREKEALDEKEQAQDKLLKLQAVNGSGK